MKIIQNKWVLFFFAALFMVATGCEKDDDESENENDNNTSDNTGTGMADVSITGDVSENLGEYATWEITEEQLLRIRVGSEFPENIVMNYRLGSTDVTDFAPGTYTAVSATYTGQPDDEIAFQYNGDSTQFPDSGTVTISSVSGMSIAGEIDVIISPISGGPSQVNGSFTAEALE